MKRFRSARDDSKVFGVFLCFGVVLLTASSLAVSQSVRAAVLAAPVIHATPARNGAVIVQITESAPGAKIYYTLDGSAPTSKSQQFLAPFLVDSSETVQAIAVAGQTTSAVLSQAFAANVASGTLVWSDEFSNTTGKDAAPASSVWTYEKGASGYGNAELEDYCPSGSNVSPCSAATPNAYVGVDGYLHIVARQPAPAVYTSARMKTEGLFSFRYGRLEFRARLPEAQGLWPAGWLLGNTVSTLGWPASGEQDVMERVDAAKDPDWNQGSVHFTLIKSTDYAAPDRTTPLPRSTSGAGHRTIPDAHDANLTFVGVLTRWSRASILCRWRASAARWPAP